MFELGTEWSSPWSMPDTGCSFHTFVATVLRGFAIPHCRVWQSKLLSARTSSTLPDALGLEQFALAGFDWGNRAACITAILHPERVRAQVAIGGYSVQNTVTPSPPAPPAAEARLWYQWYFNTERGPGWPRSQSRRDLQMLVGNMVPSVAVYRRDVQPLSGLVRQSGLRRCRNPLLPAPPRERSRRGALSWGRTPSGGAASGSSSRDCAAWGREWVWAAVSRSSPRPSTIHRAGSAPDRGRCGTRSPGAEAGRSVIGTARVAGVGIRCQTVPHRRFGVPPRAFERPFRKVGSKLLV